MVVSSLIGKSPTLLFYAQALGEDAQGDAGFGDPTRTTLFDYWGIPSLQRWMNDGRFDGGQLTEQEISLREFYVKLLSFSANDPSLNGEYADLHQYNLKNTTNYDERLFSFSRWDGELKLFVISNFSSSESYSLDVGIPRQLVETWQLPQGRYELLEILSGESYQLVVNQNDAAISVQIEPLGSKILLLKSATRQ